MKEILRMHEETMMNFIKLNVTSINERIDSITKEFTKEISEIKHSMNFTEDILEKKNSLVRKKN